MHILRLTKSSSVAFEWHPRAHINVKLDAILIVGRSLLSVLRNIGFAGDTPPAINKNVMCQFCTSV